jgi:hypothetical protein
MTIFHMMNYFIIDFSLLCFISFILLIWFESDIVQTTAKLTKTRNIFKLPEFEKYKLEEDIMSNYANFLYTKYPGYLTKLISCPICLCFWTNLILSNLLLYFLGFPLIYFFVIFPINYIFSLAFYLIIRKLL